MPSAPARPGRLLQIVGAASGGTDPLQPLARFSSRSELAGAVGALHFTPVRNVAELDAALRSAGRPVMLDFYADWCVSCKEMERFTFTDPAVQRRLAGALLLQRRRHRQQRRGPRAAAALSPVRPAGTIFFDAEGREIGAARTVGFQKTSQFLETLKSAGL